MKFWAHYVRNLEYHGNLKKLVVDHDLSFLDKIRVRKKKKIKSNIVWNLKKFQSPFSLEKYVFSWNLVNSAIQ